MRWAQLHAAHRPLLECLLLLALGCGDGGPTEPDGLGEIAFIREEPTGIRIWLVREDGTGARPLTTPLAGQHHTGPTWSPDGAFLAYGIARETGGGSEISVIAADGSDGHLVTDNGFQCGHGEPHWLPDGRRIVYTESCQGVVRALIVDRDGGNRVELAPALPDGAYTAWSPDGAKLAGIRHVSGTPDLLTTVASDGSSLVEIFEIGYPRLYWSWLSWSPDGAHFSWTEYVRAGPSDVPGANWLVIIDADGTSHGMEGPGGWRGSWSPDGQRIAYGVLGGAPVCWRLPYPWAAVAGICSTSLRAMRVDGPVTDITVLGEDEGLAADSPTWSPDGTRLAFGGLRGTDRIGDPVISGIYAINQDGSGLRALTQVSTTAPGTLAAGTWDHSPQWRP